MKRLIAFAASLILAFHPLAASANEPFIAIYTSMDAADGWRCFFKHHVDEFYPAKDFESFDKFLSEVKQKAGKRQIILDLSVHGSDKTGLLSVNDGNPIPEKKKWRHANLGMICNHIRQYLPEEQVIVVLEACYAPATYLHGLRIYLTCHGKELWTERYDPAEIPFPIYGIAESRPNLFRLALEDYLSGKPEIITDLRTFQDPTAPLDDSPIETLKLIFRLMELEP